MNTVKATAYSGYSKVKGEMSLVQIVKEIKSSEQVAKLMARIITHKQNNDEEKATHVKKQLPFLTITANYEEARLAYSVCAYNHIITIDFDHLPQEAIAPTRRAIEADGNTLVCFTSPSGNGLKVLVFMDSPEARALRARDFKGNEVEYAVLERHHAEMYELTRKYMERLTGIEVDTSGKDLGRGFYLSQDREVFFNQALLDKIVPTRGIVNKPAKSEQKRRGRRPAIEPMVQTEVVVEPRFKRFFKYALDVTRKKGAFEEGNRDSFINYLGVACYRQFIPFDQALAMAIERFGNSGFDLETPLRNGYTYTSKADVADEKKKRPVLERVLEYLEENYRFRYNEVAERMEFFCLKGLSNDEAANEPYKFLEERDYNSVFVDVRLTGMKIDRNLLKSVIFSNLSPTYDPFREYFSNLPQWDGNDYIGQLADMVQTTNQEFWRNSRQRWLVGLVACATNTKGANEHVRLLSGKEQGIGKSTWVQRILIP